MGYAVFDASYYPSPQLGVAGQIVRDLIGDLHDDSGRHGALVTSVHPLQASVIERIKKKYGRVFVGGPGALSPGNYEAADGVCIGDCQKFIAAIRDDRLGSLDNIYYPGNPAPTEIDFAFPWGESARHRGEDGRLQVFVSRGCKRKCAFCQTGWALCFEEHPSPDDVTNLPPGNYNYVSNALSDVSFCKSLPQNIAASHTLVEAAHSNMGGRLVRVGIEGVSERIRRAVGKSISNQNLVDWTIALNERGVQVRWFMIAGLPGETWDDWEELIDDIKAYSVNHKRGTLQISFTAYVPEPATPICNLGYLDDYEENHARFRDWYFSYARIPTLSLFRCQGHGNRKLKAAAQNHQNNKYVGYPHRDKVAKALGHYMKTMNILGP